MSWIKLLYRSIYEVVFKRRVMKDIEGDLEFHLQMRTAENIRRGMTQEEARRSALKDFGNLAHIRDICLEVRGGGLLAALIQDVKFGLRRMLKSPIFTSVALLSLALGIGANTAIFSLINAILLRPLPVKNPEQLVSIYPVNKAGEAQAFSYPNYLDFRDRNEVLSGIYVSRFAPLSLSHDGVNERVWGYMVSGNYFDVLGVETLRGRTFTPDEDKTRLTHPVAVISYGCWQRRFGGVSDLIGRSIILNGHTFTIIGIAPQEFSGTEVVYTPEIWVPMMMQEWIEPGNSWLDQRSTQNIFATGRLKPGVSVTQAEASLNLLMQQLGSEFPETNEGQTIILTPPGLIHPMLRGPILNFALVFMGVVCLVLLIACTNLATLLLARAFDRQREIAIRLALGASRIRIVRQLLIESVMLSVMGGAIGVLLAFIIISLARGYRPPIDFPITVDLSLDIRVLAFTLLVSFLTGLFFGLVPALQSTKTDLIPALKDSIHQLGHARSRLRSGLVVAQIALSLMLLIAAGLIVRALQHLQTMNPGFDPENALMLSVDLGLQGYDEEKAQQFFQQMVDRVESISGVRSVSLINSVPLGLEYSTHGIYVEGAPPARGGDVPTAMYASVWLNYFSTMRIPLLAGRDFNEQDRKGSERVVIVNEAFARRFFPGEDPINSALGKRIGYSSSQGAKLRIVGVAHSGKYFSLGEPPQPFVYYPMLQSYESRASLLVRTSSDPQSFMNNIRAEVQKLDPALPIYDLKTLRHHMGVSLFPSRIAAALLTSFGLLSLVLAGVGIYGVMSYSVSQRRREIGIRIALGAGAQNVLRMIIGHGLILAGVGITLGILGAFTLANLMSGMLYGVSPTDSLIYLLISLMMSGVVLLACAIPARRATRIDPLQALRSE